jgi:hypothetical protein
MDMRDTLALIAVVWLPPTSSQRHRDGCDGMFHLPRSLQKSFDVLL